MRYRKLLHRKSLWLALILGIAAMVFSEVAVALGLLAA